MPDVKTVISAIDGRLGLESQDEDEFECAVEALGHIGMSKYASKCFIPTKSELSMDQLSLPIISLNLLHFNNEIFASA